MDSSAAGLAGESTWGAAGERLVRLRRRARSLGGPIIISLPVHGTSYGTCTGGGSSGELASTDGRTSGFIGGWVATWVAA